MTPGKIIVPIVFLALTGQGAEAACSFVKGHGLTTMQFDFPPTISVPRDAPNGTVLFETPTKTLQGVNSSYTCPSGYSYGIKNSLGTTTPGNNIFPIGNTGIAWQWIRVDLNSRAARGYPNIDSGPSGTWGWNGTQHALRLIKIADTQGELLKIPSGIFGYYYYDSITPMAMSVTSSTSIVAQSCDTPDVSVDMGKHKLSSFPEYGSQSAPVSFNIRVNNCPKGINKITYTLAPTPNSPAWNASLGIVNLNGTSTAKGLGLQILGDNQQPLEFNKSYVLGESPAAGGNFSIPLTARYFRVLPTGNNGILDPGLNAGTANADIWFIMNYL